MLEYAIKGRKCVFLGGYHTHTHTQRASVRKREREAEKIGGAHRKYRKGNKQGGREIGDATRHAQ